MTATTSCCTPSCECHLPVPPLVLRRCGPPTPGHQPHPPFSPCLPVALSCSNEYVEELGRLEGVKDNMTGGGQPVELAVELLRYVCGVGSCMDGMWLRLRVC